MFRLLDATSGHSGLRQRTDMFTGIPIHLKGLPM